MRTKWSQWGGLLALVVLCAGCRMQKPDSISLYAAAGLRDAVEALREAFSEQTGINVDVDYAGSGVVLARVQRDSAADLFLPGDIWYVDRLNASSGLVEESSPVTRLVPVLIVSKGNPKHIAELNDLLNAEIKTAMGNPKACQIGRICERMLARNELAWSQVVDEESLTVNELAVWVTMNAVDAAVVWDATAASVIESVEVIPLVPRADEVSMVSCALMKTAPHPGMARTFIQFMTGPAGQRIIEQAGFAGIESAE